MPPDHFKMKTSVPAIIDQSAFLRRKRTCLIYLHYELGQYDPSLQFFPAKIFTGRQVDCRSRFPERFPTSGTFPEYLVRNQPSIGFLTGIKAGEFKPIGIFRTEFKMMGTIPGCLFKACRRCPSQCCIVMYIVHVSGDQYPVFLLLFKNGLMGT